MTFAPGSFSTPIMSPVVRISLRTIAAVLALSVAEAPYAFAQTPSSPTHSQDDHSAHHPESNAEATPIMPQATAPGQAAGMPMGMMSGNASSHDDRAALEASQPHLAASSA
jgi:hypothetical protein